MNPSLNLDLCRERQKRLGAVLEELRLDAALITDRRHVHYFSGFWSSTYLPAAFFLSREGEAILSSGILPETEIVAESIIYKPDFIATLVDDLEAASLEPLQIRLKSAFLGVENFPTSLSSGSYEKIGPKILEMRRHKDADEVALIRHAIFAAQAAYTRFREVAVPGASELAIFGELTMAATFAAGEIIGELGNNFQSAGPGAIPRQRNIEAGELWALDLGVAYRGYRCDLCRTFCIGGEPTEKQKQAHARVLESLDWVAQNARAGSSCREIFQTVHAQLDGLEGWSFPHHLGHGIGLSPHEAPRLNPHWDDTLQVGDVIAVEPGLYGPDLNTGVRQEDDFLVGENGLERLSDFSHEL